MKTTIVRVFFWLIGCTCATILALIVYLAYSSDLVEWQVNVLGNSLTVLQPRGAVIRENLDIQSDSTFSKRAIDIAEDVPKNVAHTARYDKPSVRHVTAGRENTRTDLSGDTDLLLNATDTTKNNSNHRSLTVVMQNIHTQPIKMRKDCVNVTKEDDRDLLFKRNAETSLKRISDKKGLIQQNKHQKALVVNNTYQLQSELTGANVEHDIRKEESAVVVDSQPLSGKVVGKDQPKLKHNDQKRSTNASTYGLPFEEGCVLKKYFVWIKVHKAGSQTTNPIFERFAYRHHLKLLFGISNGPTVYWPRSPGEGDYVQTKKGELFDALYVHSRYNKTWMQAHFPNDTVYLSIVKEPFAHLKSSFHYYGLQHHLKINQYFNPLKMFLKNPWMYKTEALYQGIRFDKTKNAQLFDLGFPLEKSHDMTWTKEYIKQLDTDFLLILILEYHAESLVLLKRLMCWELYDILLVEETINSRHYRYKHYKPTQEELQRYKKYAEAEYAMYQRFNRSLWNKISQQGQDFFSEVDNYKQVTKQVRAFCNDGNATKLVIEASPWNPKYRLGQGQCINLKRHDYEWRRRSWTQLRYPPRVRRPLSREYFNNISKFHAKLLEAARNDSAENKSS